MNNVLRLKRWAEGLSEGEAQRQLEHAEACVANEEHPFWPQWHAIADALRPVVARHGVDVDPTAPVPARSGAELAAARRGARRTRSHASAMDKTGAPLPNRAGQVR